MNVTRKSDDNFIISDVINNQRHEVEYLYYTEEESISRFKQQFKEEYLLEEEAELDMVRLD